MSVPVRSASAARRCPTGDSKVSSVPSASSRIARGIGCCAMADADAGTWINAGVALLIAFVVATLLDRAFRGRAAKAASERIGPEAATRLRFVRRLLYAVILLIGIAIALSGFTGINQLATS